MTNTVATSSGPGDTRARSGKHCAAIAGAIAGSIIAAIISSQVVANQSRVPSRTLGPTSIPCIRPTLSHQLNPASETTATPAGRDRPPRRARTLGAIPLLILQAQVKVCAAAAGRRVEDVPQRPHEVDVAGVLAGRCRRVEQL